MSLVATAIPASVAAATAISASPMPLKHKLMIAGGAVGGGLLTTGLVMGVSRHTKKKRDKMRKQIMEELGIKDTIKAAASNIEDDRDVMLTPEEKAQIDELLKTDAATQALIAAMKAGDAEAIRNALNEMIDQEAARAKMEINDPDNLAPPDHG